MKIKFKTAVLLQDIRNYRKRQPGIYKDFSNAFVINSILACGLGEAYIICGKLGIDGVDNTLKGVNGKK